MTDAEHAELVSLENAGKILVGVDRVAARKLLTDVPFSTITRATGYSPYVEKATVMSLFVLGPLALIGSIVTTFVGFGWWGLIALALGPLVFGAYQGSSSLGGAGPYPISALLAVTVGLYATEVFSKLPLTLSVALFVFALWCTRMVYVATTSFYRAMALRSAKVFDFLAEGIELRRVV